MNRKQILLSLIIIPSLVACYSKLPTPTYPTPLEKQTAIPIHNDGSDAYPIPTFSSDTYPTPEGNQEENNLKITPRDNPQPPSDAPQPEAGRGSASGVLVSISRNSILPLNTFYLTPAIGENSDSPPPISIGPDKSKGDILSTTNEKGEFYLSNIPSGNYYFIAWAPMDWPMSVVSPDNQSYRMIQIQADQKTLLGIVYIP